MEIKLIDIGKHKIEVIKLIMLFTELGLKESKELADITPSILKVSKPEFEFEQIKKNFAAIGAKVEQVKEVIEKSPNIPGEDLKEKKPISEKKNKPDKQKNTKKKKWEKPKFTNQKTITNYTDNNFFNLDKKADDLSFVTSVKNSLIIAVVGAAIFAVSFFYYPLSNFLAFLIIGVAIALTIRTTNDKTSRNLGFLAAAFTLLSYTTYPLFYSLTILFVYRESFYFVPTSFFSNLFSIFYPSTLIPIVLAYLIASNANLGEKLSAVFVVKNKPKKSSFNSKTYKKGNKSIKRKKRKLD